MSMQTSSTVGAQERIYLARQKATDTPNLAKLMHACGTLVLTQSLGSSDFISLGLHVLYWSCVVQKLVFYTFLFLWSDHHPS